MTDETWHKDTNWLDRKLGAITWEQALYALLVFLAIASRFVMLGARAMSHDESLHTRYSWELYDGQGFSHTPMMHGPLMFHLVALTYWLFGDSDVTSRVPAAALGVILVAFPYLLRRWLGRAGSLATSALFLISPSILYVSRYIRMDIPVILWAMVTLASSWAYLQDRKQKYLYWFAGGLSAMFATKEVAFLYVAIFGSFLAVRMAVGLLSNPWKREQGRRLFWIGLSGILLGALILGIGMAGQVVSKNSAVMGVLNPEAPAVNAAEARAPGQGWLTVQIAGGIVGGLALALAMGSALYGMQRRLLEYPEFDLIVVYSTLVLPFLTPLPITLAGGDPLVYTGAGIGRSALVFLPILALTIGVGLWWDWRRWLKAAAVFYAIFFVLFSTVFTNGQGFATGWFGSLGYWLDQQAVKRGDQPWYFYLFVVPLYEFLPLWGAMAGAVFIGLRKRGLELIGRFAANGFRLDDDDRARLFGFVPFLIWWVAFTWILYSYAGEKMGWLTTHLATPMIVLAGWFLGRLVQSTAWRSVWRDGGWALPVLIPILVAAAVLGCGPLITGQVKLGSQDLEDLKVLGRVMAGAIVGSIAVVVLVRSMRSLTRTGLLRMLALCFFAGLGLMTVRAAWMASYVNYDTAKEYIVYAHGAPGATQALKQIEDISLRLYGDLSIRVAFDNKVSWPFWWYLRDYPNKVYFGENPSRDSLDVPVALVGAVNWPKVDPYAGNRFLVFKYTYLWWPMEDYKHMTWQRMWGAVTNPAMFEALWDILVNRDFTKYAAVTGRTFSLAEWPLRDEMRLYIRKDVAAQLWDYGVGPASAEYSPQDPYQQGFRDDLVPLRVVGTAGDAEGQLMAPRGIAVGPDDLLYVLDTGNNRVQVFDEAGQFVRGWGSYCSLAEMGPGCNDPDGTGPLPLGAGQFSEPWGIAVAPDGTVYVADTWNHRIQRFTPEGQYLNSWGRLGQVSAGQSAGALGLFYGPRGVALSPSGLLYVTDTGNKKIQVFEADGRYVGEFAEGGPLDGQLDEPVGLDVGADGAIFVADTWNSRIDVFDQNHTFQRKWAVEAWYGQSVNNKPYLAIAEDGRVFVTDPEMYRVLVFDQQGTYLFGFGQYGTDVAGLALPTGIAVGRQGMVWVADTANNRVSGYSVP